MMLDREFWNGLKDVLERLGIQKGEILYISSDITTFLFEMSMDYGIRDRKSRNMVLNSLIDIFQETVGDEGTLLFPVFSWDWCKGNGFDLLHTKGEVGTLSNWVLENRKDFIRTKHPIYSFMVWGKDADYLADMDNQDAWSHASPFYYLQTHEAKQLLFNIEAKQGLTIVHYMEQEVNVPYRHPKYFFGEYIDADGIKETRMYSMYVRDLDVESGCGVCNQFLIDNGAASQEEWLNNVLTLVKIAESCSIIKKDMEENNGRNTLTFKEGELDWSKKQTVPYEVKGISPQ